MYFDETKMLAANITGTGVARQTLSAMPWQRT